MPEIQKRLEGIRTIVDLKHKREAEHVANMQQASKSAALRHLKHLNAQAAAMERLRALQAVGADQRGMQQASLDIGYEDFLRQQGYSQAQ